MRNFSFLLLFLLTFSTVSARHLSPEEALDRINAGDHGRALKSQNDYNLVYTVTASYPENRKLISANPSPALYVFNSRDEKGFVIVSAESSVVPLLGYGEGEFQPDDMPPAMQWWLEEYAAQIEFMRNGEDELDFRLATEIYDSYAQIPTMLKTRWSQEMPYNAQCPTVSGRRCATGCVATAMAQVMRYWEYPSVGTGSNSYTLDDIGSLNIDFSKQSFDWEGMKDSYRYNDVVDSQGVAYLMKACGYSVNMAYSPSESGARTSKVGPAFINYFKYDRGASEVARKGYSDSQWISIVYNELKNVGPIIYSGASETGAHCFVCDGYDTNGYFHINWGWAGMSDGYFLLSALNPAKQGTGGSSGGYKYEQTIIAGVMPPAGRLSMINMELSNVSSESGNMAGKGFVYRINDNGRMELNLTVRASNGFVASPLIVSIYETDPETMKNKDLVYETEVIPHLNLNDGELGNYNPVINFREFNPANLYTLNVSYNLKNVKTTISSLRFAASSGVNDIVEDGDARLILEDNVIKTQGAPPLASLKIYNIQGLLVMESKSIEETGLDISWLPGGIYLVEAMTTDGRRTVLKIRK